MIDLNIKIQLGSPQREIKRIIKWDNPIAIADGYSVYAKLVGGQQMGQFCFAPLFVTNPDGTWVGTWSANAAATNVTNSYFLKVGALQQEDDFTVAQKMKWLGDAGTGDWGSPMRANWTDATGWQGAYNIKQITTTYCGQLVEVLERKTMTVYFNGKIETGVMARLRTFQDSDWGKTYFTNPELVQKVTVVNKYNVYYEKPKGIIYLPFYLGNRSGWIFERWLEEKE